METDNRETNRMLTGTKERVNSRFNYALNVCHCEVLLYWQQVLRMAIGWSIALSVCRKVS